MDCSIPRPRSPVRPYVVRLDLHEIHPLDLLLSKKRVYYHVACVLLIWKYNSVFLFVSFPFT